MAAPKGNSFWKLRSKHGRDKLFASPDLLLQAAYDYFQWCDNNPWKKVEQSRGSAKVVTNKKTKKKTVLPSTVSIPTQRPYTLSGLCIYLNASEAYWRTFKRNADLSEGFFSVIHTIEEIINTQQFEGAAVGAFNANIIARKLGLRDAADVTSGGEKIKPPTPLDLANVPLETLLELARHIDHREDKE